MNSKQIMRTVVYIGYIIIYNLIFFMKGGMDSSVAGWIAYGFVWLAILISYIAPLYCKNYKRIPENLVTNYTFSWIYSAVTIVFNAIVILLKIKSVPLTLILNLIFVVFYLQQLFYSLRVNYEVETNLERTDAERQFVRDVSKKLQMCRQMTDDAVLKKEIEKAYDAVRSCPLKSNDMAMNYEIKIIGLTDTLESKMDNNQNQEVPGIVQDILNNVKKRNAML
ncbi:MAG: hypothetical protein U0K78_10040 [Agathobacter sp.]|uniref:hypothetical protein n=1 Tax=Agathobacter sp. TaxID=2021311 RepID=UPI002E79F0EC|nr:hypothetical protein [Agathobacter sp.]MEE1217826.1 hypothetical protein [Agathobacter sp.]